MSKKGFTILELLIVIGIIAVLSSVAYNSYFNVQRTARNTRRKADLKEMQTALESFKAENGTYPDTCTGAVATCPLANAQWFGEAPNPNGPDMGRTGAGGYIPNLAPAYIPILPRDVRHGMRNTVDPVCTGPNASYLYRSTGTEYKLLANCTPEGTLDPTDKFADPVRPTRTWQVSSSNVSAGW